VCGGGASNRVCSLEGIKISSLMCLFLKYVIDYLVDYPEVVLGLDVAQVMSEQDETRFTFLFFFIFSFGFPFNLVLVCLFYHYGSFIWTIGSYVPKT